MMSSNKGMHRVTHHKSVVNVLRNRLLLLPTMWYHCVRTKSKDNNNNNNNNNFSYSLSFARERAVWYLPYQPNEYGRTTKGILKKSYHIWDILDYHLITTHTQTFFVCRVSRGTSVCFCALHYSPCRSRKVGMALPAL